MQFQVHKNLNLSYVNTTLHVSSNLPTNEWVAEEIGNWQNGTEIRLLVSDFATGKRIDTEKKFKLVEIK